MFGHKTIHINLPFTTSQKSKDVSKRVHSKRIPKFSKTFPGIFIVPFNFGPEIWEVLVEWKRPKIMKLEQEIASYEVE